MAGIAVMAGRSELRIRVVRPDIGRFHPLFAILTVGYGISCHKPGSLPIQHEIHLAKGSTGILDEEISGFQFLDQLKDMVVRIIAESGIISLWHQLLSDLLPVMEYRCYGI